MTTVLLSSASNTFPMVSRNSCLFDPLAHALGSSLIISSAYQNGPTLRARIHLRLSVQHQDVFRPGINQLSQCRVPRPFKV